MKTLDDYTRDTIRIYQNSLKALVAASEELVAESPYAPKTHVAEAIKNAKKLV